MSSKFIDRIGKYFQLDLYYYIKNLFYLVAGQGAADLLGFVLSIAFAWLVAKEVYGQWNFILSIVGIFAILTLPGINTAIVQSVSSGHDRVLVKGAKQKFKWSILGTIATLGVGIYYFLSGDALLGKSLIIASLFFPFYHSLQIYASFFSGKKRFDKVAGYRFIIHAVSILATIAVIYLTRNLILILGTYLLSFSLLRGFFLRLAYQSMENQKDDPRAITFGKHVTVTMIPTQIRQHCDKIVIALFLSFPQLAIYAIARGFADVIFSLSSHIATLTFPKLSQMDEPTAYSEVKKRWPLVVIGFGVICGILIGLCPYIIPLFYSQKYVDSVFYVQLLLVSVIIAAPVPMINKALFPSQRRIKDLYKLRVCSSIIEIVLLIILTLKFGLLGAVIAILLGRAFTTIYSLYLARFISFHR